MLKEKTALIIVDAWDKPCKTDIERFSFFKEEIDSFSQFLSYVVSYEKEKECVDVYHSANGYKITKSLRKNKCKELICVTEVPLTYDRYLFCGFHYNQCILRKMNSLSSLVNVSKIGVVLNLTMIAPEVDLSDPQNNDYFNDYFYKTYYWTRLGYKQISVRL